MSSRRQAIRRASMAASVGGLMLLGTATASHADFVGGGSDSVGYVAVAVRFTGNAAPGGAGGSVRTMSVPVKCHWVPVTDSYQDPVAMLAWYDAQVSGQPTWYMVDLLGPRSAWEAAAASGTPMWWYHAVCVHLADLNAYVNDSSTVNTGTGVVINAVTYRAFAVNNGGVALPAPAIAPEALALAAREVMVIPVPVVDRNPKAGAFGEGTLVNLPTWFWVTDPAAVGGNNGTRSIRAEVGAGAGAVWAEVTASTPGLVVTAPTGTVACPPLPAQTAWSPGATDGSGCVVDFTRASVGYSAGFPVATSTEWNATWIGSDGTNGGLDPLARQATVNVPVAESQAIVSGG